MAINSWRSSWLVFTCTYLDFTEIFLRVWSRQLDFIITFQKVGLHDQFFKVTLN